MLRIRWGALALAALVGACTEDQTSMLTPYEAGPLVAASQADLLVLGETATDPYLTELLGGLGPEEQGVVGDALASFGTGVSTSPNDSYRRLEAALGVKRAPASEEDMDAVLAMEVIDLYRAWSETVLYGVEN